MESCDMCGKKTHERELGWHQAVDCKPVLICWSCESDHTDEELFIKIHGEHPADKGDRLYHEEQDHKAMGRAGK